MLRQRRLRNRLISVLDGLRASGVIVPDKVTGGKGYKDINVTINGNVANISVTLALVENIEWILSDISVTRAQF
jgi:hypothetical protein